MSPSYSALAPVSAAVYTALNVAAVTNLATGGVFNVIPQNTAYPCVLFECSEAKQLGGFGTKPGVGQLPEMDVRVHVFSQNIDSLLEAQNIIEQCLKALADPPAVAGYGSWGIFHDSTIDLGDQLIANVTVHEVVALFRMYVEQAGA